MSHLHSIAVTVKWDDKNAIDILRKKVEEVSYPLGEDDRYTDESKDILNLILRTFAPKNFPLTDFFKTLTDGRK